jgi:peroxiredoxin family protein
MVLEKPGLGIIFHSGSYDRLHHGFSLAMAASASGREVKLFFAYWALEYMKKGVSIRMRLDGDGKANREILENNLKRGHLFQIFKLISEAKSLGAKFYACTNSMGLLNISRDELIPVIDSCMGIVAFLAEIEKDQIIFI